MNDFSVSPGLALTSWLGFMTMGHETMVMGDLVLLDIETGPVVVKLAASHLSLTAMHNHLVNEKPAIKYIHVSGSGNALELAAEIKSVLGLTGTPLTPPAQPAPAAGGSPDWSKVEAVNHMLYDEPRLFMMHFWAVNDPEKLAIGLKAALDKTNSKL